MKTTTECKTSQLSNQLNKAFESWRANLFLLFSNEYWNVYHLCIEYVKSFKRETVFERISDRLKTNIENALQKIANGKTIDNSFAGYISGVARNTEISANKEDEKKFPFQENLDLKNAKSCEADNEYEEANVLSEQRTYIAKKCDEKTQFDDAVADEIAEDEDFCDSANSLVEDDSLLIIAEVTETVSRETEEGIYNYLDGGVESEPAADDDLGQGGIEEISLTSIYEKNTQLTERDRFRALYISNLEKSLSSTAINKHYDDNYIFIQYMKLKYYVIKYNLQVGIQVNLNALYTIGYLTKEDVLAFSKETATIPAILAQKYSIAQSTISRMVAAKKKVFDISAPFTNIHKHGK